MAETGQTERASSWLRPLPLAAFFTPVIAAPSGRGLVPVLLIIGMWAFMEMLKHNKSILKETLFKPITLWVGVASLFIFLSGTWAGTPGQSVKVGFSFLGISIFGLLLLSHTKMLTVQETARTKTALVLGMSVALVLLSIGAAYGLEYNEPLWGKEGRHPIRTLSHAQTVIGVLLVPCIAILWYRGVPSRIYLVIMVSVFGAAFYNLEHGASDLAVAAACVTFILVRIFGAKSFAVLCCISSAAILLMPYILGFAIPDQSALDAMISDKGPWPSEIHRLHMWRFVTDAIANGNFVVGYGADASRGFPGATQKIMWGIELMPLHPHNGALQIWLELGLIGVLLIALVPLLIAKAMSKSESVDLALSAAFLAAYMVPWVLSYGIWQSWWMALAWLVACIGRGIVTPEATGRA